MHELPGSLAPDLDVSLRRSLGRARDPADADAHVRDGEGRRVRAGGRRARIGQEPARARVRRRGRGGRARWSSTAPATRSCAPRTGRSSRRSTSLARVTEPDELRAALGTARRRARRACSPTCRPGSATLPPPVEADPDTERHRLHTAVTDLLDRRSAGSRPVLLVIEDGHWADAPTLLLLRHLARGAGSARAAAARHLPRHRGRRAPRRCPRRSPTCAAPTTSSGCGSAGLSGEEVAEFVRRAAGGGSRSRSGRARAGDQRPHRGQRRSWSASCGGRWSRPRASRSSSGTIRLDPPAGRARHPRERSRGRQPAALARLAPGTTDLLELAATAGSEFELDDPAPRRRPRASPSCAAALDEAVRSGMIEEVPSRGLAYRFTHELVRRALYDRLTAVRRAELHLRVGEALAEGRGALGPGARRPRPPLRRGGAARRRRARRSSTTCAPRAPRPRRSPSTRRRRGCAPRSSCGIEDPAERAEVFLELGTASHRAGKALDALAGVQVGGGDRPRARRRRAARAGRDRLRGGVLAARDRRPGRRRAARGGGGGARRRALGAARRAARRARSRARLPGRPRARGGRPHERDRDGPAARRPRRPRDRADALLLVARHELARGDPRDADRGAGISASELGDTEIRAEAMAWRVPAFVALCDLESARRGGRRAARDRRADGAAVHAPRRRALRLGDRARATGASTRPRPRRSARTSGAGC